MTFFKRQTKASRCGPSVEVGNPPHPMSKVWMAKKRGRKKISANWVNVYPYHMAISTNSLELRGVSQGQHTPDPVLIYTGPRRKKRRTDVQGLESHAHLHIQKSANT